MFMHSGRDQSVLRSLALSFGEGLAFSVGAKLIRNAARPAGGQLEPPDFAPVAARLEQMEQRMQKVERPRDPQQLDQKVIQAIVSALETRLQEQAVTLRAEVKEMHREFASTVAQVVGEQVALRAAEMEARVQERVAAAMAPLEAELAHLRERMAETENTMAEFVSAIGLMCRKAAERKEEEEAVAPPAVAEIVEPEPAVAAAAAEPPRAVAASPAEPILDIPLPAFAQARKPPGIWSIPVASSFLFAFTAAGLLLRAL
jgi:hypothetical protein